MKKKPSSIYWKILRNVLIISIIVIFFIAITWILIKNDFSKIKDLETLQELIFIKFIIIFSITILAYLLVIHKNLIELSNELTKIYSKKDYFSHFSMELLYFSEQIKRNKKRIEKRKKLYEKQKEQCYKNIALIGHEIKNPLSSILGYAQILKEELSANNIAFIKFTNKIINNAKRIEDIVNVLQLSIKLRSKLIEPNKRFFNLKDSVLQVKNGINTNRNIFDEVEDFDIFGDKLLIEQVILNLLDNALKYSKKDILLSLKNGILEVQDFGIGIEKSEISKITKEFYQIKNLDYSTKESMGLGLAIVSYILKLHNLKLDIDSTLNFGSTFKIDFNPIKKNIPIIF